MPTPLRGTAALTPAVHGTPRTVHRRSPLSMGVRAGEFTTDDTVRAALHILITVDGLGAYANDDAPQDGPDYGDAAIETAEVRLGLAPGTLRARARRAGTAAAG